MKKILLSISSFLIFLVFSSTTVFSAGDEENIKKLSSFKKTDGAVAEVIDQNTKFASNIKKISFQI